MMSLSLSTTYFVYTFFYTIFVLFIFSVGEATNLMAIDTQKFMVRKSFI
jgi:hypothetical protein